MLAISTAEVFLGALLQHILFLWYVIAFYGLGCTLFYSYVLVIEYILMYLTDIEVLSFKSKWATLLVNCHADYRLFKSVSALCQKFQCPGEWKELSYSPSRGLQSQEWHRFCSTHPNDTTMVKTWVAHILLTKAVHTRTDVAQLLLELCFRLMTPRLCGLLWCWVAVLSWCSTFFCMVPVNFISNEFLKFYILNRSV